jgi:hypothetical protein
MAQPQIEVGGEGAETEYYRRFDFNWPPDWLRGTGTVLGAAITWLAGVRLFELNAREGH